MMDKKNVEKIYSKNKKTHLDGFVVKLVEYIDDIIDHPRKDRITGRAKDIDSFVLKSFSKKPDGTNKYDEPFSQIQDQIGVRIITYYKSDVTKIEEMILEKIRAIEKKTIIPDEINQFGYEGRHLILTLPVEIIPSTFNAAYLPDFFELQIKTLFQHAWSQAEHDITYKTQIEWPEESKRKIAFTAAQSWGADLIFEEMHNYKVNN